jgi:hypothetical protein
MAVREWSEQWRASRTEAPTCNASIDVYIYIDVCIHMYLYISLALLPSSPSLAHMGPKRASGRHAPDDVYPVSLQAMPTLASQVFALLSAWHAMIGADVVRPQRTLD